MVPYHSGCVCRKKNQELIFFLAGIGCNIRQTVSWILTKFNECWWVCMGIRRKKNSGSEIFFRLNAERSGRISSRMCVCTDTCSLNVFLIKKKFWPEKNIRLHTYVCITFWIASFSFFNEWFFLCLCHHVLARFIADWNSRFDVRVTLCSLLFATWGDSRQFLSQAWWSALICFHGYALLQPVSLLIIHGWITCEISPIIHIVKYRWARHSTLVGSEIIISS